MSHNILAALADLQSRLAEQTIASTDGIVVSLPSPWWEWLMDDLQAALNGVAGQASIVVNLPCGPMTIRRAP